MKYTPVNPITVSTPDQIAAHQSAVERAFAYLRSRNAIHKLEEHQPVYGRDACMWLPASRSTLTVAKSWARRILSGEPVGLARPAIRPIVRFVKVWPPPAPVEPTFQRKGIASRLNDWLTRILFPFDKPPY
jgi:hypothetical protein